MKVKNLQFDKFGFAKVKFSDLPQGSAFLLDGIEDYILVKIQVSGRDVGSVQGTLGTISDIEPDELVSIHREWL